MATSYDTSMTSLLTRTDIGTLIMNYIMDLSTFRVLYLVSSDIKNLVLHPYAWADLDVHLERSPRLPWAIRDRLRSLWRYVRILYVDSSNWVFILTATCCTSFVWSFKYGGRTIRPGATTTDRLCVSADSIPPGMCVCFALRFAGYMPSFTVGFATDNDENVILRNLDSTALSRTSFRCVRLRLADTSTMLRRDRALFINGRTLNNEAAIRLPRRTTGEFLRVTTLMIMTWWDFDCLSVKINNDPAMYYSHPLLQTTLRDLVDPLYLTVMISRQRGFQELTLRERLIRYRP